MSLSLKPVPLTEQELAELPPPQPLTPRPKSLSQQVTDELDTIEDEEDLDPCKKAANLLDSCMTATPKQLGDNICLTAETTSEVVLFALKTFNLLQDEVRTFSQKCIDVHKIFYSHLLDLSIVVYGVKDCQKIRAHWHEKGKAICKLLYNGKKGRNGGLASDLEHLRELVSVCSYTKLIEQVEKQNSDVNCSAIEFPNLWGNKPIIVQKNPKSLKIEFVLMKTLYSQYFKLLWGCIDHLNEVARPIYRTLGIIQCFPDEIDLIAPYVKPKEKSSSEV